MASRCIADSLVSKNLGKIVNTEEYARLVKLSLKMRVWEAHLTEMLYEVKEVNKLLRELLLKKDNGHT